MRIIKLTITFLIGVILLSSCQQEKSLTLDFPYDGDELVLYSFINDSVQHAEIYKTQEVLEDELDFSIVPKRLELYENESLLDSFNNNQNNYVSTISLDTLSSFQVQLEADEKIVFSNPVFFPEKIKVKNYQTQLNSDSSKVLLNLSFDDKQGEHFYLIQIDKYYQGEIENLFDEVFYENFRNTFSDEGFSEQTFFYEEELDLSFVKYFNGNIVGIENSNAISITLYSLSKEIYKHYQSVKQNSSSLGSLEESNVPIWTNINKGQGVVGAYRKDFIFIEL